MMERASERAARIGAARAAFDRILIDYPPMTAAIEFIEELRVATTLREEGAPCGGGLLNAPTGSGKTVTMKLAAALAAESAPEGTVPILYAQMPTAGTTDSIPSAILAALGHARPDMGKTPARWLRAVAEMRERGVEVLVFDEFNRASRRHTMSRPIVTEIREQIMDAGVASVVFVGTEEAAVVLGSCEELLERLEGEIDLSPLDWAEPDDRQLFVQFVADVDEALVENGVLSRPSELAALDTAEPLCEISGGRLRPLMRVLRLAMTSAVRRHGTRIELEDLQQATDEYAVRFKLIDRNPFA